MTETNRDPSSPTTAYASVRSFGSLLAQAWYSPMLLAVSRLHGEHRRRFDADVRRWSELTSAGNGSTLRLLAAYPEFRTLACYRMRRGGARSAIGAAICAIIYPGERTLHLTCADIGAGLFIQHGFATVVAARKVGENCWINQQVTIGFDRPNDRPSLGDNVSVHAGAKVFGDITVGDGAKVGANAVVRIDVPPGYTAVGVPARLLPPKSQRS